MKINEVNAPLFRSEKDLQDERVKKVFFDKITTKLTSGLEQQIRAGTVTAAAQAASGQAASNPSSPTAPTDPFAAKRAQAAAAARANMASNPAPAAKPAPPTPSTAPVLNVAQQATQTRQQRQAAAAQAAQSQMSQNPVKPKVWRNGRDPNQPATTREHKFYQSVNAIFESLINIDEAQPATTGPITISDYIGQAFVHFMNNPVFKTPAVSQILIPLAKKVEDTYATDKGKAAIQELVDFGYNTLYKLKNSTGTAVPNNRNTSNAGNAQIAVSSKFAQAISIIDQLNPKQKKKILSYINGELNPTAAAPNNEKFSIGGQEIKPGEPLYDKVKGNLD